MDKLQFLVFYYYWRLPLNSISHIAYEALTARLMTTTQTHKHTNRPHYDACRPSSSPRQLLRAPIRPNIKVHVHMIIFSK